MGNCCCWLSIKEKWEIISNFCCPCFETNSDKEKKHIPFVFDQQEMIISHPEPLMSQPMYPPGRILHIIQKYPSYNKNNCEENTRKIGKSTSNSSRLTYQIIETDNKSLNQILISSRMLKDHVPDNVLKAMREVINQQSKQPPKKPPRAKDYDCNYLDEYCLKADRICNLNSSQNSLVQEKQAFKRKLNEPHKEIHNKRSESKIQSVCSYDQIQFAPLAKPESLSDVTQYEESIHNIPNTNNRTSNRSSCIKFQDENELVWWNYDCSQTSQHEQSKVLLKLLDSSTSNTTQSTSKDIKTSTPRTTANNSSSIIQLSDVVSTDLNSSSLVFSSQGSDNPSYRYTPAFNRQSFTQQNKINLSDISANKSTSTEKSLTNRLNIKPQSKDYILYFDSSIEFNSSSNNTSNNVSSNQQDVFNTLNIDSGLDTLNKYLVKSINVTSL